MKIGVQSILLFATRINNCKAFFDLAETKYLVALTYDTSDAGSAEESRMRDPRININDVGISGSGLRNGARRNRMPRARYVLIVVALIPLLLGGCGTMSKEAPENLGIREGRFVPCPDSPNCISSTITDDDSHYLPPFPYSDAGLDSREVALNRIVEILETPTRETIRITQTEDDYIRAEFVTRIWRFVDDVEFFFPEDESVIHFRSASRVGYSDLGANRKRIERILSLLKSR